MQGIYGIVNIIDGKKYIGSSNNVTRRWREHRKALYEGTHWNTHLQNAWNKYGDKAFLFTMVEEIKEINALSIREQYWIEFAMKDGIEIYNCIIVIDGRWAYTDESRQRMSKAAYAQSETRSIASKQLWADPIQRKKLLEGRPTAKEQSIRALEWWNEHPEERERQAQRAKIQWKNPEFHTKFIEAVCKANIKPYPAFIHRTTGEVILEGVNLRALCRERNLDNGGMTKVKNGQQSHYKGWQVLEE